MPGSANLTCHKLVNSKNNSTYDLPTIKAVLHFKWAICHQKDEVQRSSWPWQHSTFIFQVTRSFGLQELLYIFNSSFSLAHCPHVWRVGIIIPLLKAGKSPGEVASFHLISLTSCVVKLLECSFVDHLYYINETKNLFSQFQAEFWKGLSYEDQIT